MGARYVGLVRFQQAQWAWLQSVSPLGLVCFQQAPLAWLQSISPLCQFVGLERFQQVQFAWIVERFTPGVSMLPAGAVCLVAEHFTPMSFLQFRLCQMNLGTFARVVAVAFQVVRPVLLPCRRLCCPASLLGLLPPGSAGFCSGVPGSAACAASL